MPTRTRATKKCGKRRSLRGIIIPEAIDRESRLISQVLLSCEEHLIPTTDLKEQERRASIMREGGRLFLLGCALLVKEFHRDHYREILSAAREWTSARFAGRNHQFAVRRIDRFAAFEAFFGGPLYVAAYDGLKTRLRATWRERFVPVSVKVPRFVSRSGRYGEAQYIGTQRRNAIIQSRAASLQVAIQTVLGSHVRLQPMTARRIARSSAGPGDAALASLAALCNKSRRTMKAHLGAARKLLKRANQIAKVLDARGWKSLATGGQVLASQAPGVRSGTPSR